MKMQLKLLGVLQDFGTPYASLYSKASESQDTLYIAIEQGHNNGYFNALLLQVACKEIREYLNGNRGLGSLLKESAAIYRWSRRKNEQGSFTSIPKNKALNDIITDDEPFDIDFCSDYPLINYNLDLIGCNS